MHSLFPQDQELAEETLEGLATHSPSLSSSMVRSRRCEESWFDWTDITAADLGFRPAGELNKLEKPGDDAIDAVADLAEWATDTESKLKDVKKEAERKLSQIASNEQ